MMTLAEYLDQVRVALREIGFDVVADGSFSKAEVQRFQIKMLAGAPPTVETIYDVWLQDPAVLYQRQVLDWLEEHDYQWELMKTLDGAFELVGDCWEDDLSVEATCRRLLEEYDELSPPDEPDRQPGETVH
jgi:hypothetical protein